MSKTFPKTPEEQLALMRGGNKQDFLLKMGGLEIPVRILNLKEEQDAIANAKMRAKKLKPEGGMDASFESGEIMKAVLLKAANIGNVQMIGTQLLNAMSSHELDAMYDQYVSLTKTVNPEFEKVDMKEIGEMIAAVKKKDKTPRDFFTWQLAAIGHCYLVELLREVKEPGR